MPMQTREPQAKYFSDAAAHHRSQMDRVQDVPDSLRLLYELHGESGAWQGSPLYGRRTGQFKIEPLDYKETAVFHPNLSAEDNSLIYGITGGVPHYINKLDVRDSVMKLCWIISLTAPAICMRNRGTY